MRWVTKVRGSFDECEGSGTFDADNPANSSLRLTIQAASIDTCNPDRDAHLRSNDFLDMENFPEVTFVSTAVDQVDPETYAVRADGELLVCEPAKVLPFVRPAKRE